MKNCEVIHFYGMYNTSLKKQVVCPTTGFDQTIMSEDMMSLLRLLQAVIRIVVFKREGLKQIESENQPDE